MTSAGLIEIARRNPSRERDLHYRRQQPCSLERIPGGSERATDRRQGDVSPTLRQAKQGHARLRLAPETVGLEVCGLCLVQLAAEPVHLRLLVVRARGSERVSRLRHALAGTPRFLKRRVPLPVHLHHLDPVHHAGAVEGDHLRL